MEKLELKINEGVTDVVIRQGDAAKAIEAVPFSFSGDLRTVGRFLDSKAPDIDLIKSVVVVNLKNGSIVLHLNIDQENGRHASIVSGSLKPYGDLNEFRVNSGYGWDVADLGNLLKFLRRYFLDKQENMRIVACLKNFKAQISRELEKSQDDRGNHRRLDAKAVTTDLPDVFTLVMPIFESTVDISFDVEMVIEEKEGITRVKLQSVDLIEKKEAFIKEVIDHEVQKLPAGLTVIYE